MKFLDQVKIFIKAGDGGSGSPSFRREKFIEFGGPDGGDGGKGGSIIIKSERNLNTLIDFRYQQHFKAERGENGMGKNKTGRGGKDIYLKVPVGTQILEEDNKTLLFDFTKENETFLVANGGKGGFGNTRFKSSTNRAPKKFTKGAKGEEVSGPEYGKANLFNNRWCIITKQKTDKKVEKVERFWKKIGCKVIFMNPEEHDKIFAITSHLPHLIAYNLIKTAQDFQHKERKNLIKFSAGGLRDFSRTAASNEIMWRDIFFNNKKNMLLAINMFSKNLNSFKRNIEKLEDTKLRKKLLNSKKIRKEIIKLKQDVSEPDFGRK